MRSEMPGHCTSHQITRSEIEFKIDSQGTARSDKRSQTRRYQSNHILSVRMRIPSIVSRTARKDPDLHEVGCIHQIKLNSLMFAVSNYHSPHLSVLQIHVAVS